MLPRRHVTLAPIVALGACLLLIGCAGDDREGGSAGGDVGGDVELVDTGLDVQEPIALVPAPTGDDLLIAQRGGTVVAAHRDDGGWALQERPVVDLSELVGSAEGERGLLGLAVSPDGEHLYASYTAAGDGASQVDELALRQQDGDWVASAADRRNLVDVAQPYANHNGGHLEFGPDGMLYLGLGDGGSGGDPEGRAQDPTTLLGKLLRLDPSSDPPIPADNPFVGDDALGARDEIWATGLRNPWRFSFDPDSGDLWIGDVGQDRTEEIDLLAAADGGGRGANLGWDLYEGDQPFDDADPAPGAASRGPFVEPVHTYGRDQGCSVTGGVVYRGAAVPALEGAYLFSDLCTPGVRALRLAPGAGSGDAEAVTDGPAQVVGFGTDRDGEVYVLSLSDGVFQLSVG